MKKCNNAEKRLTIKKFATRRKNKEINHLDYFPNLVKLNQYNYNQE